MTKLSATTDEREVSGEEKRPAGGESSSMERAGARASGWERNGRKEGPEGEEKPPGGEANKADD